MDEFLSSAALNPGSIGPTLPPMQPFQFPTGPTGPTGSTGFTGLQGITGPTVIVSVIFRQDQTPEPTTTTLTLPAINVGVNQIVKLEGVFGSVIASDPDRTEYSVSSSLNLFRDLFPLSIQIENK